MKNMMSYRSRCPRSHTTPYPYLSYAAHTNQVFQAQLLCENAYGVPILFADRSTLIHVRSLCLSCLLAVCAGSDSVGLEPRYRRSYGNFITPPTKPHPLVNAL